MMMFLCMKDSLQESFFRQFKFISNEELGGVSYPLFFCDDQSLIQDCLDDGSCILYDIMTFTKGGE